MFSVGQTQIVAEGQGNLFDATHKVNQPDQGGSGHRVVQEGQIKLIHTALEVQAALLDSSTGSRSTLSAI